MQIRHNTAGADDLLLLLVVVGSDIRQPVQVAPKPNGRASRLARKRDARRDPVLLPGSTFVHAWHMAHTLLHVVQHRSHDEKNEERR